MESILIAFLTIAIGFPSYAQNKTFSTSIMKVEKTILIVNDTIIGSIDLLNKISPDKVLELNDFKERKLSSTCLFIENKKTINLHMNFILFL
jgi:hypothetical protein